MYPLASTCGSSSSSETDWTGAHGASRLAQSRLPLVERPLGELQVQLGHTGRRILPAGGQIDESGVLHEVGAADDPAEVGPVAVGLEEHELDVTSVLRPIDADERVDQRTAAAGRRGFVPDQRGQEIRRKGPHRGREERDVDDRASAAPRSLEQGGRDTEREGQRPVAVAHGSPLSDRVVALRRRQDVRHPATRPEGRRVVPGVVGVRAPDPVSVPSRVDEPGVTTRQLVGIEAGALQRPRPHVGQEDVGRLEQAVEDGETLLLPDVEREGALPPVGQRQGQVDATLLRADPLGGQAPVRIPLRGLDVHHLCAPVGQQGPRDRDEDPLGQLDDPDPLEGLLGHHAATLNPGGVKGRRPGSHDRCGTGRRRSWATARTRSSTAAASRRPMRCCAITATWSARTWICAAGCASRLQIPVGVLGGPAHGGDHQVVVAVSPEDQRGRAGLPALSTGRGQQQDGDAVPDVTDLAVGLLVAADVFLRPAASRSGCCVVVAAQHWLLSESPQPNRTGMAVAPRS